MKQTKIEFEGTKVVTWREGFFPECNCLMGRLQSVLPLFPCCPHIAHIANRRNVGDPNFLFKSEGGKL